MEPKKNPKSDVGRNSSLYFVIGLAVTLGVVYTALEWKTYDEVNDYDISMNVDDDLDEEVPMTEQIKTPPPPPPPAAPEVIEVVEDEEEVEETVIESTETSQEEEVMEVEDVEVEEEVEDVDVPFAVIEDVPIFPGCKGNKSELKKCFNRKMQKHFVKKFDTDLPNELGLSPGRKRLIMLFKIDKQGNIVDIRVKAPHPRLEKEAARIVRLLPKMKPGKQRGKAVGVKYTLPMRIDVE